METVLRASDGQLKSGSCAVPKFTRSGNSVSDSVRWGLDGFDTNAVKERLVLLTLSVFPAERLWQGERAVPIR